MGLYLVAIFLPLHFGGRLHAHAILVNYGAMKVFVVIFGKCDTKNISPKYFKRSYDIFLYAETLIIAVYI